MAELDPLYVKLSALAPSFGRAREDIDTIVSRGKSGDYKGVMQNARLVLEAVLRSLVSEELKQTPGKAMLDELVTKFRQQANAGLVPTNILAHMGTVQAWGNLSSHDHAGSLADEGVKVGQDEVLASLNSLIVILSWYVERKGGSLTVTPPKGATAVHAASAKPSRAPRAVIGGVAVVGALAAGAVIYAKQDRGPPPTFEALDALYTTWREPPPPPECRRLEDAPKLAKSASNIAELALVDPPTAEVSYLIARASFEQRKQKHPALDVALKCPGFAAAELLAGRLAAAEQNDELAEKHFSAAVAANPKFLKARIALAGMQANHGELDGALREVNAVLTADPDSGSALLIRAFVEQRKGLTAEYARDICRASQLGVEEARQPCSATRSPSP